jgi:hypothetical protein
MMQQEAQSDIGLSLGLGLKSGTRKLFQETREKFMSSSGTGSDLFSEFVKENEKFVLQCSSHSSVSGFGQNECDFIRSFSAGSGRIRSPLQTEGNLQSPFPKTSPPAILSSTDSTVLGGRFPMFLVSNRQIWAESWNEKFSVSHSSYEYQTSVCR